MEARAQMLREKFPSAYESVAKVRQTVGAFAQASGFSMSDVSDIVLAVGEACNNAVEHGHVQRGEFIVTCSFDDHVLCTEVCDNGCGYNGFAAVADLDPGDCVGRGRGIPIMRALMDVVEYRSTSSGTTATLKKRLLARGVEETGRELRGLDAGGCRQA